MTNIHSPKEIRADLVARGLDSGLDPLAALRQARQIWAFISHGDVGLLEMDGEIVSPADEIVGIRLHADGRWRRIGSAGFDVERNMFISHPIYRSIRPVVQDGQRLVEIPAFFVRSSASAEGRTWEVSACPIDGFVLHPAFHHPDGRPAAAVRVGAYAASERDNDVVTEDSLKPLTSISFDAASERYRSVGNGWRMWSIYDLSAIQILAMIEMGGVDVQAHIARGNVDGDGVKPGGSTGAVWRGIHELWGNVWQMVDGLRISADGVVCVWNTACPGSGEWVRTDVEYGPGDGDGYPARFHDERGDGFDLSLLFLPSELTSDQSEAIIPDWVWGHWGRRETVAYHGGYWCSGASAGLWALHGISGPTSAGADFGGRLAIAI